MIVLIVLFCLAGGLFGQTVAVGVPDSGWLSQMGTVQNCTIDAAGKKCAMIFRIPKSGTITRVGFMTGTVTTSQSLLVGLETVSSTDGNPTGSAYGGSSPGIVISPASNTWYEATLGAAANGTAGDVVAAVIQFSGTAGNLVIRYGSGSGAFGYVTAFTTTWAKAAYFPIVYLVYTDNSIGAPLDAMPAVSSSANFNVNSTPDERGIYFKAPVSGKVLAARWYGATATGAHYDVVLYDAGGTVIATVNVNMNQESGGTYNRTIAFPVPPSVVAGNWYRLVLKPNTGANLTAYMGAFPNASARTAWLPNAYYTYRTDGGSWAEDPAVIYRISAIIGEIACQGEGSRGGTFAVCY